MNKRKSKKQQITEAILAEISKSNAIYQELPLEHIMFKWWFTGRQDGLRLTDEGVLAFKLANITFYDCEFKQDGQSYHSFILDLNNKIKCPYYLGMNKVDKKMYIRLYDSKIAMMLNLYGDIRSYLDSIKG